MIVDKLLNFPLFLGTLLLGNLSTALGRLHSGHDSAVRDSFEDAVVKPVERRLAPLIGSETFLAIRVLAPNCNPACSEPPDMAKIADDLYLDTINIVTQYDACSFGQFTLSPADTINGVILTPAGVYEVSIDEDVFDVSIDDTRALVNSKLSEEGELGPNWKDDADKFIYFFPKELDWPLNPKGNVAPGWGGGDTLNLNEGFYESTCGHMHEYGHTLGLSHATEGGKGATEYGDVTGQMGSSAGGDEFCEKCFNGPHNWFLGWYADRHVEIVPEALGLLDQDGIYELVGLAQYEDSDPSHVVVLKIALGFPDYYVSFNRDVGINQDTGECPDKVLVHSVISANDPKKFTDLRACLSSGDTFSIPGGEIEVTSIDTGVNPGIATVSVHRVIPPGKLDVFFLVDDTSSFLNDIDSFKAAAPGVIADLQLLGDDVHFGIGRFQDYAVDEYGDDDDVPYQRLVEIPADDAGDGSADVLDAINNVLAPIGGGDPPESQLEALYQAVTGLGDAYIAADQAAGFRDGSARFILVWTDSGFHDSGTDGDYPGHSFADTIEALLNAGVGRRLADLTPESVRVVGVVREPDNVSAIEALKILATQTGAVAPAGGVDCSGNGSEIIPEGEPIVCINGNADGIGPAFEAAIGAVIQARSPTAECENVQVGADQGNCSVSSASIDDGSFNPSGGPVTTAQNPAGPYSVGTNQVSLAVTNNEGLQSFCFGTIEVLDHEPPILEGVPSNTEVECDAVPPPAKVVATDNCITLFEAPPPVSYEEVREDGSCDFSYTLERTWTSEDKSGNEVSGSQIITVDDTTPPEISCHSFDISPDDVNMNSPVSFTPTATDNCQAVEDIIVTVVSYDCYKINKKGVRVKSQCKIELEGDTAKVFISGGVGTVIEFEVLATQPCGGLSSGATCNMLVTLPPENVFENP